MLEKGEKLYIMNKDLEITLLKEKLKIAHKIIKDTSPLTQEATELFLETLKFMQGFKPLYDKMFFRVERIRNNVKKFYKDIDNLVELD